MVGVGWGREDALFLDTERFLRLEDYDLSVEPLEFGQLLAGDTLDPWTVFLYFLIGGLAGCASHASMCPVDVVKTRQQTDPELYRDEATGEQLGMVGTFWRIVKSEGPCALFTGLEATAAGYFVHGSLKYGLWYILKFQFGYSTYPDGSAAKVGALVLAALLAELVACTCLCPYERARTRLVKEPYYAEDVWSALQRLQEEEGFFGGLFGPEFSTLGPTLLKMVSYAVTKLTVFQLMMDWIKKESWAKPYPRLALTFLCAVFAAILATFASQPGDALQTQASIQAASAERKGMIENARELGWTGLTTGWRTRIVMFSSMVVVQLMVYDSLRLLFGLKK